MLTRLGSIVSLVALAAGAAACSTAPQTQGKLDRLDRASMASIDRFKQTDPSLAPVLDKAAGWAILPAVGEAAVGVGGLYGRGELWEHGKRTGYCDVSAGTIGAELGGQKYMELIVFQDDLALNRFKSNVFAFDAKAAAVAVDAGAAAKANYADGVIVFTHSIGGLMLQASIGGQKFTYEPTTAALDQARAYEASAE